MKKNLTKKVILLIIGIVIVSLFLFLYINNSKTYLGDNIVYNNKTYNLLEYNMDIFTYNYNGNDYLEEDMIHPITHNKWDIVYFGGDLFVLDKQSSKAIKYYSNDNNYEWFIVFDDGENTVKKSISISKNELNYLYNIEDIPRNETMVFEDIKLFGDIVKVSKDGLVFGIVTLAQCKDSWYYKTEIMTDDDKEYIIELPDSLNKKIFKLLEN